MHSFWCLGICYNVSLVAQYRGKRVEGITGYVSQLVAIAFSVRHAAQ